MLRDAGCEQGLIIARIAREVGGRWGFHALGLPGRGTMYKDSLPQIRAACKVKTSSLMVRSESSGSFGSLIVPPSGVKPQKQWLRRAMRAFICKGSRVSP
mmetsp:Transcript_11297/g.28100  ORF Transcript_11297/g.28100 Transcript_11297/m.28100 type:complete len:100 (-) Transcript_11297:418-717(-)